MPFADRDAGMPIQKFDAAFHIVRDGVSGAFKAIIVTALDTKEAAPLSRELAKWCTDPDQPVLVVSPNVAIHWEV